MLQMLVERRELVAVEVHDAPAALALKEAAVRCAAVGAELIVRALVRRDLVDAALPLELFKLPVHRRDADVLALLAQRVDDRRRADRRVRALRKAVEHCLLLFGRIGRHSGLLNLKMKINFKL